MKKYAACVVLYNATDGVIKSINSYYDYFTEIFVINNDSKENEYVLTFCNSKEKITYINLMNNYGIAYALNVGCNEAIKNNYDYILTMDQDSVFKKDCVKKLIDFVENSGDEYAIVGANAYALYYDETIKSEKVSYVEVTENTEYDWLMTSGSLMNLLAFKKTNGFDESMFIDHVDIDIGIQFRNLGYKNIKIASAILYQHFGNSRPKKFLFWTVHPNYDNPVRTYYLFRNNAYLKGKYLDNTDMLHVSLFRYFIKIIFFEDQKLFKLYLSVKGYFNGKKGKMGQYKE